MEHCPPQLLPWLEKKFPGKRAPDYEAAAADLKRETGLDIKPDTLRHVACGYKPPGGLLAASIQTWSRGKVNAVALLSWEHYSRERAA